MRRSRRMLGALVALGVFGLAGAVAEATPITGSQAVNLIEAQGNSDLLGSITEFSIFKLATTAIRQGDFATYDAPTNLLLLDGPLHLNLGAVPGWTLSHASWGTFTATALVGDELALGGQVRAIDLVGYFKPAAGWFGNATAVHAEMTLTFSQTGGISQAIGGTGTLYAKGAPYAIPEPASLVSALLGVGIVGGATAAGRRRRNNV